jgi:hypothetical protein
MNVGRKSRLISVLAALVPGACSLPHFVMPGSMRQPSTASPVSVRVVPATQPMPRSSTSTAHSTANVPIAANAMRRRQDRGSMATNALACAVRGDHSRRAVPCTASVPDPHLHGLEQPHALARRRALELGLTDGLSPMRPPFWMTWSSGCRSNVSS